MPAIAGAALFWGIGSRWPHRIGRIICLTDGSSCACRDHEILRRSSVPFLIKPFSPWDLRDLVAQTLEAARRPFAPRPPTGEGQP
jgi:hypothetical protein